MPKLTEEQIRQARDVDLLDYLQTYEPENVIPLSREVYQRKPRYIQNGNMGYACTAK